MPIKALIFDRHFSLENVTAPIIEQMLGLISICIFINLSINMSVELKKDRKCIYFLY